MFDDLEIVNINSSKGVGVQQITCTGKEKQISIIIDHIKLVFSCSGGGQYSVWDFVSILMDE